MGEPLDRGNYNTGDSFAGSKDYLPGYLASIKRIPKMSAAEETDLLARWHNFKDEKARERVIEATLHMVPPIAFKQAGKFKLDRASPHNANYAKATKTFPWGRKMQRASCARDLISEGNLALVKAFDAFPERHNGRFENYARTCIRNAICRHAVSLLSVVNRPWGKPTKNDFHYDQEEVFPAGIDIGCRWAKRVTLSKERPAKTNFAQMRQFEARFTPKLHDLTELPWILQARIDGLKLKDIAAELGVSIPTAHRRVKAAIHEVCYA